MITDPGEKSMEFTISKRYINLPVRPGSANKKDETHNQR